MNPYLLKKESEELRTFPHITEFALKKISTVQFNSLNEESCKSLRIYYVVEGRFEWMIENQQCVLYPGDVAIILPHQSLAGQNGILEIGSFWCMHLELEHMEAAGIVEPVNSCELTYSEWRVIRKILLQDNGSVLAQFKNVGPLFQAIQLEFLHREIGYASRINHLIDELLILIARQRTRQDNLSKDCPQKFMKLEQTLREDLSHQWTVEEMAASFGLGLTAFSEKVKRFTGFSPLNYLINLRISEATRLLKQHDLPVTDIALDVGFYSSQHFATTFKKLTGYTPSEYRKKNMPANVDLCSLD